MLSVRDRGWLGVLDRTHREQRFCGGCGMARAGRAGKAIVVPTHAAAYHCQRAGECQQLGPRPIRALSLGLRRKSSRCVSCPLMIANVHRDCDRFREQCSGVIVWRVIDNFRRSAACCAFSEQNALRAAYPWPLLRRIATENAHTEQPRTLPRVLSCPHLSPLSRRTW